MRVKDPAALRRKRKNQRFTQRELAYLVRRSQSTIYLLENGKMTTLSEDLALALAGRLKCDWEDLFVLQEHEVMSGMTIDASDNRHSLAG
jgi:putative transcriptional regulator